MAVMGMPMIMLMIVRAMIVVVMPVIVAVVFMTVMMVVMVMVMHVADGIGAALGLERRFDSGDLRPEALQQRLDVGVALEPELALENLHRHVTIPQMPGEPRERRQIGGADLDQRLRLGHDLDEAAIIEHQRVVGAKPDRLGQIELHAGAFDAEQKPLLRLPLCVRQDQRIDDGSIAPVGGRNNAGGAGHESVRSTMGQEKQRLS